MSTEIGMKVVENILKESVGSRIKQGSKFLAKPAKWAGEKIEKAGQEIVKHHNSMTDGKGDSIKGAVGSAIQKVGSDVAKHPGAYTGATAGVGVAGTKAAKHLKHRRDKKAGEKG